MTTSASIKNKNKINLLFPIFSTVFTIGLFALNSRKLILALAVIFSVWSFIEYKTKNSAKTLGVMSFFLGSLVLFALYFNGSLSRIFASIILLGVSLGFFSLVYFDKLSSAEFGLAIVSPVGWLLAVLVLEKFLALTYFPILTTFGAMILTLVFWLLLEVYSRIGHKGKKTPQMLGILLVWVIVYILIIATVSLNATNF